MSARDWEAWASKPDPTFNGLRVVNYDGTAFIETVNKAGDVVTSTTIFAEELGGVIRALERVKEANG